MSDGLTDADRDTLVAALLTAPVIEPGSSAEDRVNAFRATLGELNRQGGARKLFEQSQRKQA